MTAYVGRQYGVFEYDDTTRRVREKRNFWAYGQAMNMATRYAIDHPELIIWMCSRVVICDPWELVEHEGETTH